MQLFFFNLNPPSFPIANSIVDAIYQLDEWVVVLNISGLQQSFTGSSLNALLTGYRISIIFGTRKRQSSYLDEDCLYTSSCSVPYLAGLEFYPTITFCKQLFVFCQQIQLLSTTLLLLYRDWSYPTGLNHLPVFQSSLTFFCMKNLFQPQFYKLNHL